MKLIEELKAKQKYVYSEEEWAYVSTDIVAKLPQIIALLTIGEQTQAMIKGVYEDAEGCADGAPDASDHDKLCNQLCGVVKPYLDAYELASKDS